MVMNLTVSPNHVSLPLTSKPQEEQYQTQATKAIQLYLIAKHSCPTHIIQRNV
jgi:hypothetical protein